ncbi:MAG: hypothetical protein ACRDIB_03200, partial [Ardenticatenaceae bacterium]
MPTISEELPNAPAVIEGESETLDIGSDVTEASQGSAMGGQGSVAFVWSDALVAGMDGDGWHTEHFLRAHTLLQSTGALHWREVSVVAPERALASIEALGAYHDLEYIQSVHALSEGQASTWAAHTFGFSDEGPLVFPGMAERAGWSVAAARRAVQVVLAGELRHAFSPAGSQPHARRATAVSGDIFNDVLLALRDARDSGRKVAFLNLEAEHPIVIEEAFYHDPEMLFISLHEDPHFLYPGTGMVRSVGEGAGTGFNINVPLPPGAADAEYLA